MDNSGTKSSVYFVRAIVNGKELSSDGNVTVLPNFWKSFPITVPAVNSLPDGSSYYYTVADGSTGDLDGDGQLDLVFIWNPSNMKDNSLKGYTGNVWMDGYTMAGKRLFRIDLGKNIRAGCHYTQFVVADFDGNGMAEIMVKTAPDTKDGTGYYLSNGAASGADHSKDYRNSNGYILSGPEWLTVFRGTDGKELATVNYIPERGTVRSWGDSYGNRVDRFLASAAWLDGVKPSGVFQRGYYTRMSITAWDWNGVNLTKKWNYNAAISGSEGYSQGNHNLSVGDVDKDGKDEIIQGSCAIDHDGKFMYRTGLGHGDAMHLGDLDPDSDGLEVYCVHEETSAKYGYEMHNARTGAVLWGVKTGTDNGRGIAADVDASNRGYESWSFGSGNIQNVKGQNLNYSRGMMNFRVYWDADLLDETLEYEKVQKLVNGKWTQILTLSDYGVHANDGNKYTPCLSADLFGDWREEIVMTTTSFNEIRIFTTTALTQYKLYTLMHDPVYRAAISWQNTAYNQPPHLGFWLAGENWPTPDITLVNSFAEPRLTKQGNGSEIQNVAMKSSLSEFGYVWADATTVSIEWEPFVPEGINVQIDNASKKLTFSGIPTVSGVYTYTVTTISNAAMEASATGKFTIGDGSYSAATLTKQGGGSSNQSVASGSSITEFNYVWSNAISAAVEWSPSAPKGIVVSIDNAAEKVTFSGSPSGCDSYHFTISTVGPGAVATKEGSIHVAPQSTVFVYENSGDMTWANTANWLSGIYPSACDTAIIRTGEVKVASTPDVAYVKVEENGTFRITAADIAVDGIKLQGGTIKSYTSSPFFELTSVVEVEENSSIMVGSVETSVFEMKGSLTGSSNLEKTSVGTLKLSTDGSGFEGFWILTEGTIQVSNATALGTKGVTVSSGATLDVEMAATTGDLTMATGSKLNLDADLTVSSAMLGGVKLVKGIYTSADYPDFIFGSGNLTQITH